MRKAAQNHRKVQDQRAAKNISLQTVVAVFAYGIHQHKYNNQG
jgi:hypothetical protein